jgi:hypothetical protein
LCISVISVNFGEKRAKDETPEEKRERKKVTKELRKVSVWFGLVLRIGN